MERKIVVYGNPDRRPVFGFPNEAEFKKWIKEDIFSKNERRYHYTQRKPADVIVLSRLGLAYGHFRVRDTEKPNEKDRRAYPPVRFVYIVGSSALYCHPVRLADLGIKGLGYGKGITEEKFDEIKEKAGGIEYHME